MKISYIVAVYNVAEYLKKCIESICNQTYGDIEIILVDDGSNDGSEKICDRMAAKDTRIKVIHQNNCGVSVARNRGIELAHGEWVCFIDGDDWIDINIGANLLQYLDMKYELIFFQYVQNNQLSQKPKVNRNIINTKILSALDIHSLRIGLLNPDLECVKEYKDSMFNYRAPWGKLYKREFLIDNNLFFKKGVKRGQDLLFNLCVYKVARKSIMVPVVGYYYRIRPTSIGNEYNDNIFNIDLILINGIYEQILEDRDTSIQKNYYMMVVRQFIYSILLDCLHKDNPYSYKERKQKFLQYRNLTVIQNGFEHANLNKFKFRVLVFSLLAKYRLFRAMEILTKIKGI